MMKPGLRADCSQAENARGGWGEGGGSRAGGLATRRREGGGISREEVRREKRAGRFAALGRSRLLSGPGPEFLQVPH